MGIILDNMQDVFDITEEMENLIISTAKACLEEENLNIPTEVNIILLTNEEIRKINLEHRNIDKPTDVLSFPMLEMIDGKLMISELDFNKDQEELVLGDIIISTEKVIEQARQYNHSIEREIAFLVTHGMFHLLGYDHQDENSEKNMILKQENVLEKKGLS